MRTALAVIAVAIAGLGLQTWRANYWAGEAAALRRERSAWTVERAALREAISTHDAAARQNAETEARRLSTLDRLTAGDVSSAYQKGLAAGRVLANVQTDPPIQSRPDADGVRDYRAVWGDDAYRPGA
ncbi:MAG: hypothetical protein JWM33_3747 [Caulobacteraceae bacterium]|nr:hypothetical protein [Caulobacteraceae bacterium]